MKKVLFIDRDGTLIVEPPDEQIDSFEKWEFFPGVLRWLGNIARDYDYELVLVTNQDGMGTEKFPEHTFWPVHQKMLRFMENEGIVFHDVHIDTSFEHENKPTRKPGTGMLQKYLNGAYDLPNSFVIGDRKTDVLLAANLGCKSIRIGELPDSDAHYTVKGWKEIYQILGNHYRCASVLRKTSETEIEVKINLNGSGKCNINTGIGFFDHMLEQWARHGGMDMEIKAKGDLHVDAHHLVEDVAIVLGQAIDRALGSRKGISRYGFVVPMDDSQALVSMDFGGRASLVWKVWFSSDSIGGFPTEMLEHFIYSFAQNARCNIHIEAYGANNHHKAEAIFKATARAMRMAFHSGGFDGHVMSTKGVL